MSSYAGYRPYTNQRHSISRPRPPALHNLLGQRPAGSHLLYSQGSSPRQAGYPGPGSSGDRPGTLGPGVAPYQGTSTPTPTPTTPADPTTGGSPGGGGAPPKNEQPWLNDPAYQQIVAIANADVQNAQAAATGARKQAVIALGDPGLAASLGLGKLVGDTAQANPFSTLKNLLRGHLSNVERIDKSANRSNLWSSSTRTRGQQQEGVGYQGGVSGAADRTQSVLANILAQLLAAKSAAATQIASAAGDAYTRHLGDTQPPDDTTGGSTAGMTPQQKAQKKILDDAIRRANAGPNPYSNPTGGV